MQPETWDETEKALDDLDFPAGKEQIVSHARRRTRRDDVARLLRALPLGTYDNLTQVRQSVRIDPAAREGQSASRKSEQARSHHSHQIAEYLRDVQPPPRRRRGGV